MHLRTHQNGKQVFTYCDAAITVPRSATNSMLESIKRWQDYFPHEATYVQKTFGVPCLTIRFDGVIHQDGTFTAYELQPAGAGIGYAGLVNERFRETRERYLREKWPPFKLVQNVKLELDDEMWLERIPLSKATTSSDLLQLRHPLDTLDAATARRIVARSVKPVRFNISKEYGEKLGWWKKVVFDSHSANSLPWDEGFALKPLWGWGSYDIMIWHPVGRPGGSSTRSQILKTFERQKVMYMQSFIPPMQQEVNGDMYNVIVRPFFGYDPQNKKWEPWGGTWNGRPAPALRIHGSSDAIAGPLILEQ